MSNNPIILIVDDSSNDRDLYKAWLEQVTSDKPLQILEAENVKDGLEICLTQKPDCIILDFLMLDADGFQFLTKLKEASGNNIPSIIFTTGHHSPQIAEDALALGAQSYLNKNTISMELLHKAVNDIIR